MCFVKAPKMPNVDTGQIKAPDPAPLTEEPKGVLFGGEATDSDTKETSGKSSLKVKKEPKGFKTVKGTSPIK